MFDFVHSDPRRTWIGTLFEVCMIVLWSFCITREVYCSGPWLQTKQKCTPGQPSANASQYQNVRIWGSPLAHLRHCLRPRPLCNIFRTTPLALNGISMAGLHFFPPLHPTSVVCIPRSNTLEIHFQVNMLWLAANLQPTGVVTAVPDNSQNKLLSRSGMFTVTTDIFASFIWKERDPVISFTQMNHKLNLLALFYFSR